jgi:hypothetical protein
MSFALTTEQIRDRTKTVTRRLGWRNLKPGENLRAVVKCQGLKKGQTVTKLALLKVVGVRIEPLRRMIYEPRYGRKECVLEGFSIGPYSDPEHFVDWFCLSHKCNRHDTLVTRIEFEYVS